jgi:hypothetical protein
MKMKQLLKTLDVSVSSATGLREWKITSQGVVSETGEVKSSRDGNLARSHSSRRTAEQVSDMDQLSNEFGEFLNITSASSTDSEIDYKHRIYKVGPSDYGARFDPFTLGILPYYSSEIPGASKEEADHTGSISPNYDLNVFNEKNEFIRAIPTRKIGEGKTIAALRPSWNDFIVFAISGWSERYGDDDRISNKEGTATALKMSKEMKMQFTCSSRDQGPRGQYYASHAEMQLLAYIWKNATKDGWIAVEDLTEGTRRRYIGLEMYVDNTPCLYCRSYIAHWQARMNVDVKVFAKGIHVPVLRYKGP